eukprot:jgi/Chrzof1/198/Cz01g06220.t1
MASLKALLQSTKLEDVFQPRSVISFDHDTPIAIVLETLSRNRILSAPVFVRTIPGQEASVKSLLGFVDVGAVLQAFLNDVQMSKPLSSVTAADLEQAGETLYRQPVLTLFGEDVRPSQSSVMTNGSDACRDWSIKGDLKASLLDIIKHGFLQVTPPLAPPSQMHPMVVHRLAVFDCTADPNNGVSAFKGVFSQTDMVRVLQQNMQCLGHLGHRTLQDLGLASATVSGGIHGHGRRGLPVLPAVMHASRRLVCVKEDTVTLEAFLRMYSEHVSGIGVLSSHGEELVGNISVSDLRCLAPGLFWALLLPVKDFLAKRPLLTQVQLDTAQAMHCVADATPAIAAAVEAAAAAGSAVAASPVPLARPGVVTCQATSMFGDVLHLVVTHGVHRAYVVDPDQIPVGVLTLTDVLQVIANACQ